LQPLSESADETSRLGRHIPFSPATGLQPRIIPIPRAQGCQSSQRGIKSINLQFRDADNEAGGAGGTGAWPQRQPEQAHKAGTGENIVHDIAKEIHSISHHRDILCDMSYDIACDIAS